MASRPTSPRSPVVHSLYTVPVMLEIAANASNVPPRKFSVLHCNIGSPVKHSLHFAGAQSSGRMLLAQCTFLLVLFN